MDGQIVFSNDGILRFRSHSDNKNIVPLILIQEQLKLTGYQFFLRNLQKSVMIEEGSTMGSFILALTPWADVASDLLDRNVKAYIDELRKPSDTKNAFDRVEIKKLMSFNRDIDFGERPEDMDWLEWLNTPKEPKMLNTFEMEETLDICGYVDGDENNYSMSMTTIGELKNVPLVVNRVKTFIMYKSSLDKSKPLINKNSMGVNKNKHFTYIDSKPDTDFTLMELIEAVFVHGLFYEHPSGAADTKALLTDRLSSLHEDESELDETDEPVDVKKPAFKVVNENGDLEDHNIPDEKEENDGSIKEIHIAEGAFDSVIRHYQNEDLEWKYILESVDKNSKYPIRIGEIKEEVIKDRRLRGSIIED